MKKIVLSTILFMLFSTVVSAEEMLDYSLMGAELPKNIYYGESPEVIPSVSFFGGVDLGNEEYESWEEEFYNKLDSVYSPDNIVNQTVGKFSNIDYYIAAPYVEFPVDYSMGELGDQVWVRLEQIHEVYARYLQDNPEYFYLMPRQYGNGGAYYYPLRNVLRISFAPIIAYDIPGFDGSKSALQNLRTQYYELMEEIDKARDEIYFEGMTDLDKLLLAHDYIVENTAYYLTYDENGNKYYGNGYSYNSYGVLVNKRGVCQGLSYAYPCLLKALGYPIENIRQIRSDELAHMWNFIKLGDDWYHVDLTWDDPLYASSDEKYDMTNEALQHEHHEFFLISNNTNTAKRNAKGYENFTLEILGYEDSDCALADNASFETGKFFNDPVNNALKSIPGSISYENGMYKKNYDNTNNYFLSDTLTAQKYMVSQVTFNQYNVPLVYVLGAKQRELPNETVTQYMSYYDNSGRLLKIQLVNQQLTGFGMVPLDAYITPAEGETVKIITVDKNFNPVANVPIMK